MYRKYYLVEVVLLLLLSHGGWNGPSVTLLSCTSESSKLVRDVVQKRFLSVVERYRVSLPLECPLHPRRDMFGWLQTELEATRVEGEENWNCPVCGQKFRCENTFVTHWDASHARRLGMAEETVCLDDYCDVFRCDVQRRKMLKKRLEEDDGEKEKKSSPSSYQGTSLYRHAHRETIEDEEVKQMKKNCDPKTMVQVHNKCRSLIRQCTIGMVANLSSKDFQDIEEDLDQSVCSFLTCEKYWDDFETQDHQVPMLVIVIFGLVVISLFGFCYYGLWILFEKSAVNSHVCCNCQKPSSIDSYYRQKHPKQRYRQKSPEYPSRKNSPEFPSGQNSPDYTTKQNFSDYNPVRLSPDYTSRQNSPEDKSRRNSPEEVVTRNSPERVARQNSPEYNSKPHLSDYRPRKNSPDHESRQNSPEYRSKAYSSEFRSRKNSPEYPSRQDSREFFDLQEFDEYHLRRTGREHISRQNSPEFEAKPSPPNFRLKLNPSHKNDYNQNPIAETYYRRRNREIGNRRSSPDKNYNLDNNKLQIPNRAQSRCS